MASHKHALLCARSEFFFKFFSVPKMAKNTQVIGHPKRHKKFSDLIGLSVIKCILVISPMQELLNKLF